MSTTGVEKIGAEAWCVHAGLQQHLSDVCIMMKQLVLVPRAIVIVKTTIIDNGHQISHDDMNNDSPNEHGADHVKYHMLSCDDQGH